MDSNEPGVSEPVEVLVRFKSGVTLIEAENIVRNLDLLVIKSYPPMAVTQGRVLLLVRSNALSAREVIALMQDQPQVLDVELNVTRGIQKK